MKNHIVLEVLRWEATGQLFSASSPRLELRLSMLLKNKLSKYSSIMSKSTYSALMSFLKFRKNH